MGLTGLGRGAVLALVTALLIAGCGSDDTETVIEASSPADEALAAAIVDELHAYDESFDLTALPPAQQDELSPIVNNLPPAAGC
jgi:hypothetical protein